MSQAIQSIITSARPAPAVMYLPEIFSKGETYFPELRSGDATRATIVADIASAQHDDIVRVIGIDLANNHTWDASTEIADLVLDIVLAEHNGIPVWCEDFLERHLGINRVREAEYEYRHAA